MCHYKDFITKQKVITKKVITKKRGIGKEKENGCSESPMFYFRRIGYQKMVIKQRLLTSGKLLNQR